MRVCSVESASGQARGEGGGEGDPQGRERVCLNNSTFSFSYSNDACLYSLLILAADITPIDIISHLPVMSEEAQIPYVFVSSKEELGHASSTKRPTSCVMVCPDSKRAGKRKEGEKSEKDDDYRELYEECCKEVAKLDQAIVF